MRVKSSSWQGVQHYIVQPLLLPVLRRAEMPLLNSWLSLRKRIKLDPAELADLTIRVILRDPFVNLVPKRCMRLGEYESYEG